MTPSPATPLLPSLSSPSHPLFSSFTSNNQTDQEINMKEEQDEGEENDEILLQNDRSLISNYSEDEHSISMNGLDISEFSLPSEELNEADSSNLTTPPPPPFFNGFNPFFDQTTNELILLNGNKGTYVGWDRVGVDSQAVGVIQSENEIGLFPLGDVPFFSYFEVTILDGGKKGYIGIGIAPKGYKNAEPGWRAGSFGYHGDDGRIYNNSGWGKAWGPTYTKGDVVGCLVNIKTRAISFTKNGVNLGIAFNDFKLFQCEYCMTVGLHSNGEEVNINFGNEPFLFDVRQYARESCYMEPTAYEPKDLLVDPLKELITKIMQNEEIGESTEMQVEFRHLVRALMNERGIVTDGLSVAQLQPVIRSIIITDPIVYSDDEDENDQVYQQKDGELTEAFFRFGGSLNGDLVIEHSGVTDRTETPDNDLNRSQRELSAIANGAWEVDSPEGASNASRIQFTQAYDEYFPASDESSLELDPNSSI